MKKKLVLRNILIDIGICGVCLVVFALFHHVLPRQQESMGIVIENPNRKTGIMEVADGVVGYGGDTSVMTDTGVSLMARGGRGRGQGSSGKGTNAGGMSEKGGSAADGASAVEETDDTAMEDKFAEVYTEEVTSTEDSYASDQVSVSIEKVTENGVTYYLADIYLKDVTALQTVLAKGSYGSGYRDSILSMAESANALVAVNGDYYGNTNEGVVIRNGVIYRANATDCDVCVLYYDGTMRVIPGAEFSVQEAIEDGAWQAWTFGPSLLNSEGEAITSFSSTRRIQSANPRTAIGYYEKGHYCLVVVDGRGDSDGMTLQEMSALFERLGCKAAYNLDGGNSSIMVWGNEVINEPSGGGRTSSDAIVITEVPSV